jgi:hypothetical protein
MNDDYVEVEGTNQTQPTKTGIICKAGFSCRLQDIDVVVEGNATNGSQCCQCEDTFHFVCLFRFEEDKYCKECYKEHVVKQCSTATLFEDILRSEERAHAEAVHAHTEKDLLQHVDNYLKAVGLKMTTKEFDKWTKTVDNYARSQNKKTDRLKVYADTHFMSEKYKKAMEYAKEDWLLSTNGVVKALHYKLQSKEFVARVEYKKENKTMKGKIAVSDDWVIDTYGKEFVKKLMDREEHSEFIVPVTEDGKSAVVKLDNRTIIRVKYYPAKHVHRTDDQGNEEKTEELYAKGIWKGMMDDGTVLPLSEELVTAQFGTRFVQECQTLGQRKFVHVPVGSCRSSLMTVLPQLRCENAPPVHFMQGEIDSCVFSSLAPAFHSTALHDLVKVSIILRDK